MKPHRRHLDNGALARAHPKVLFPLLLMVSSQSPDFRTWMFRLLAFVKFFHPLTVAR